MSRRNTELLLLIASAFPVILLYAMCVLTASAAISFETLAVPIGLFAAFAAAHIAVRILAPGADPAILPIVFILSGIGITFVTRLAPALAISQLGARDRGADKDRQHQQDDAENAKGVLVAHDHVEVFDQCKRSHHERHRDKQDDEL